MYIVTGAFTVIAGIAGYALPRIRHLETELPDHIEES